MQFQDIKPGTEFTAFRGQSDRVFTKTEDIDTSPFNWPQDAYCGTCG